MDNLVQRTEHDAEPLTSLGPLKPRRRRQAVLVVFLGAGVVVFALYNSAELIRQNRMDSRFTPRRWVSLDEPPAPSDGGWPMEAVTEPSLRVAVAPIISPEKSLQRYSEFVNYLAEKLDTTPIFMQRETYAKVNDLVRYGRCDLALVCTYAFVRGEREFGMEVLAVPEIGGAVTHHSLILVPESSKATSLLDLREKRFASADIRSNSGWLYPAIWLKSHGEDANSFFSEHVIAGSHDRSVTAVASAYVDGAAVDSLVYDQMVHQEPAIANRTRIILKSPPFGMPPLVVPPQIDPDLKQQLLTILLDMHRDPEGRKVLSFLRVERFVVPDDGLFDSVREASKVWEAE